MHKWFVVASMFLSVDGFSLNAFPEGRRKGEDIYKTESGESGKYEGV
jgi:hypothetical protein